MPFIITDKHQINKLQKKFQDRLAKYFTERIKCTIGYNGGTFPGNVYYSHEWDMWFYNFLRKNRQANLFGIGRPREKGSNSMTVQINFPLEDSHKSIAAVFAKDEHDGFLVLHRGRIGGGKPGVNMKLVMDNFRGDFIKVMERNRETSFCLVGALSSAHFPGQVASFVNEIGRIKSLDKLSSISEFEYLQNFKYTDEHFGQITTEKSEGRIINRTHGIVVRALSDELQKQKFSIANDKNRDLFIHKNKTIQVLFEVKTTCSTQSQYAAVAQLLIYSIPVSNPVKLIAVLPEKLSEPVEMRLKSVGITPLYYSMENEKLIFSGLDKVLISDNI